MNVGGLNREICERRERAKFPFRVVGLISWPSGIFTRANKGNKEKILFVAFVSLV